MASHYTVKEGDRLTSSTSSYKVLMLLGSGVYGQVFVCRKQSNNQIVALKVLKDCDNHSVGQKEARILEMLRERHSASHNIVQCAHSFHYKGYYCNEFEKLDISLLDLLKISPGRRLPLDDIRPIIAQLARALIFLKAEGIAHCDLKPDNIMLVDHVGQPLHIKVIDFGQARSTAELTHGLLVQPAVYRAPEVFVGAAVTGAIDMWSVGCIAAQMFLGQYIFYANDELDLMRHITETVGQPPRHLLDEGRRTHWFFSPKESTGWEHKIPFRSCDHPSTTIKILDDMIDFRSQTLSAAEICDCSLFVDLLKRMLDVNPNTRITPDSVLQHPFITMNTMRTTFPSYAGESLKIMAQVESFTNEEQQSSSTTPNQINVGGQATKEEESQETSRKRRREEEEDQPKKRTRQEEKDHDVRKDSEKYAGNDLSLSQSSINKDTPDIDILSSVGSTRKRKREEEEEKVVPDRTSPSPSKRWRN